MIYDENSKTEQERGSNNIVKDWQQFANDGMLWLVNMILHIFGWAIIYQYDNESKHLYNEIKDKEYLSRKDYQKIAQYCVQVYEWFTKANANKISEISNGVKIWFGAYSKEIGLSNEDEIYYI